MESKMAEGGEPVTFALGDYNCSVVIAAVNFDVSTFIRSEQYKDRFVGDDLLVNGPPKLKINCWLVFFF